MSSNFPNGPDTIVNNVANNTPEMDTHPSVHNQLADAVMAVETALLPGGTMNLAAHVSASDPHPVYLTQVEGDARYTLIGGGLTLPLSQNLTFSPDATYDIGASGANRPRNLYMGGVIYTSAGTVAAPSVQLSAQVGLLARSNTTVTATIGGNDVLDIQPTTTMLPSTSSLGWSSGKPDLNAADLNLWRDAANTLAQRGGTAAQTFRIYSTYTDASNYARLAIQNNGGGIQQIFCEAAGTGTQQALSLNASQFYIATAGVTRWTMPGAGHLLPAVDNTVNVGDASHRVANAYIGNAWAQVFVTTNDFGRLEESNSGGRLLLTKQTAANVNPGANKAAIYLRDGTTGGTLKLVVRAGAAGAETTILDNIPQ